MKILFIFPRQKPYDSRSVRELPSGGTEKCVIFLGEALQKLGHEVHWVTTPEQLKEPQPICDVVVTQVAELLENFPISKRVWWTHHFSDQPVIQQNAAYGRCYADKVVTLSQCHHDDFKDKLKIDSEVIGHGVWLDELARGYEKDPYRLIYASTPFRGLERIPKLFKQIKEKEPQATIAICSSMETYGEPEKDAQYAHIFAELSEMEGVELLGSLNQEQLYREYAKASIFFYPCIWPETYCLALDEAKAHGCYPITPNIGALPERVDAYAELQEFAECALQDMKWFSRPWDDEDHKDFKFMMRDKPQDWMDIARQWEAQVLA